MNKAVKLTIAAAAVAVLPVTAQASVLDFTSHDFIQATGFNAAGTSGSGVLDLSDIRIDSSGLDAQFGDLDFDVTTKGGRLKINTQERNNGTCLGLLDCGIDGLGVGNDEISGRKKNQQELRVDFGRSVWINEIYFLDLFEGRGSANRPGESATVDLLGGDAGILATYTITTDEAVLSAGAAAQTDTAVETGPGRNGGFLRFDLSASTDNFLQATGLVFRALRTGGDNGNNDYAFAGLQISDVTAGSVSQVPLPPGGVLFVTALFGLAYLGKRRQSAGGASATAA